MLRLTDSDLGRDFPSIFGCSRVQDGYTHNFSWDHDPL